MYVNKEFMEDTKSKAPLPAIYIVHHSEFFLLGA